MKRLITIVATTIALASLTGCVGGTIKPLYTDQITEGKTAEVQVKKIYATSSVPKRLSAIHAITNEQHKKTEKEKHNETSY